MWFERSAKQGQDSAMFMLGTCYEEGRGVDQDLREAAEWYEKAIEAGYPAQESLDRICAESPESCI